VAIRPPSLGVAREEDDPASIPAFLLRIFTSRVSNGEF
jgi:hypothetical protein